MLIASSSYKEVHATLQEIMAEDYAFLCKQFAGAPAVSAAPAVGAATHHEEKKKVQIKVSKAVEPPVVPVAPVVPIAPVVQVPDAEESTANTLIVPPGPKTVKQLQHEAEEKKKAELDAAGISITDILTKENLTQWIVEEKRSYSWVAREKAGCPDSQVAAAAKGFGIQSNVSKRKGILAAMMR
jgi:hypothetical protein